MQVQHDKRARNAHGGFSEEKKLLPGSDVFDDILNEISAQYCPSVCENCFPKEIVFGIFEAEF